MYSRIHEPHACTLTDALSEWAASQPDPPWLHDSQGSALVAFKHKTRRALDKIREVEDVVFQLDDGSQLASTAKPAPARKKG